ncbi:MAG: XRE family transcriptional regulator [Prevotellaceae bacterium]|nr:XRE family transcriptional regulator [Prevotellaceae bacterium]
MAKITLNELKQTFARRLRVARLMCGLSQAELVAKMKELAEDFPALYKSVSTTAVERYENAVMFPENSSILVTLAEALNTNVDNLTRQFTIRIDKDFSFRKKSKLGKKRIDVVKMKVQQCIEKYVEIENITGDEPKFDAFFNNIVVKKAEDARLVANELRKKWNLGDGPISQPMVMLEEHGVKVIEVEEDPELFDGTSTIVEGLPVVVLNKCESFSPESKHTFSPERRNLTLFHELGHQIMNIPDDVSDKEKENLCNVFANEMLIPSNTFLNIFGNKRQAITIVELKDVQLNYGISARALMMKAHQLGVINKSRYVGFCIKMNDPANERLRKTLDGSSMPAEHTSRYERLVFRALSSETITTSKAAEMLDISVSELRDKLIF